MALLEIESMRSYYAHIHVVRGISPTVQIGEAVTLIGSNGAGKTATLRSVNGSLPPREGTAPHDMISKGIAPRDARSSAA